VPVEPRPRHPDDVDPEAANYVFYNSAWRDYRDLAESRYGGNNTWLAPILLEIGTPRPGARALDVGSAVGTNSLYLAEEGYAVTGVDLSLNMVMAARAASKEAGLDKTSKFVLKDFFAWRPPDGSFDLVLATAFVHLFRPPKDRGAVEKILSHVAPGGTAIVSTTVELVHSQRLRPKQDDLPDRMVPPGLERWRNHYTGETFWDLVQGAAADKFGAGCTVVKHVVEDPGRPGRFWSDIVVTRDLDEGS
jgi:SAM-dependent methyltransferase